MKAQNLAVKGVRLLESLKGTLWELLGCGFDWREPCRYVGIQKWEELLWQVMWTHVLAILPSFLAVFSGSVPKGQNVSDP